MRDRLIELLCNVKCEGEENFGNCPHRNYQKCNKVQRLEMCSVNAIADHLLAAGVIVPPCKMGDVVWVLNQSRGAIYGNKVVCINIRGESPNKNTIRVEHHNRFAEASYRKYTWSQIGKQVFLSKEDAQKALAERGENEA